MKLFERIQIGRWDAATLEKESISGIELMERAGNAMARYLVDQFPGKEFHVFCGQGNNGGDGLVIARILFFEKVKITVYLLPLGKSSQAYEENLGTLKNLDILLIDMGNPESWNLPKEGIILDALLGTGVRFPLPSILEKLIPLINHSGLPIISLDIPSGINPDPITEPIPYPQPSIQADKTLFLEIPKLSALFPGSGNYYGEWSILPIGLDPEFYGKEPSHWYFTQKEDILKIFKSRKKFAYKGDFGHSLLMAGAYGKAGAAVLSTRSCIASGSGLVSTLSPEINSSILQSDVPEAMFIPGGGDKILTSIPKLVYEHFNAFGLGPGLGTDPETSQCIIQFIKNIKRPLVIDADALNILSSNANGKEFIPEGSILTPHVGEFNRLSQGGSKDPFQRLSLARALAGNLKSIIILKGAYTAIVLPNQEVHFNSTGNPGMATGGSGDVLTGILTGLLAQGYTSKEAALLGVYIHGRSGDIAAQLKGENALKAGDLCDCLGSAFLELERLKNPFAPGEPIPDRQTPPE